MSLDKKSEDQQTTVHPERNMSVNLMVVLEKDSGRHNSYWETLSRDHKFSVQNVVPLYQGSVETFQFGPNWWANSTK